jgi:hypothetical protein
LWAELDAGLEEGAGFADGLEGAVQFGGSGAVDIPDDKLRQYLSDAIVTLLKGIPAG